MTWVKVCGLRTKRAVSVAASAGADAIGFVLHERSPRSVTPEVARELIAVANGPLPVAVTRDADANQVMDWVETSGALAVQPHGRHQMEVGAAAARSGLQVILPMSPAGGFSPTNDRTWIPMLDNVEPGSGNQLDWDELEHRWAGERWILAGGLSPSNVGEALSVTAAWGVDASSGLESAPGVKDLDLIEAFVRAAKETSPWEQRESETRT